MSEAWAGVAGEFLHSYPRGARLIAVTGADAERSKLAADALSAALVDAGQEIQRVHSPLGEEQELRDDVIAPFRAERAGRVLIVSGPPSLLSTTARGLWNFTVWQLAGDEPPHSAASALVDVTDADDPQRRFADYCALPASYGA
ncbi:hypothetical protein ACI3KS_05685 [Microbacterium sp. ZW T5_45]|uniref:hypothetical protein n=1 Tax=Microbacterium sp. ZW T5_45 TaxID=3378080 RepID=UPI003853D7EF